MNAKQGTQQFMLALVVWRESRGETLETRIAVAHSVLNRVSRPSWWGSTITQVLAKKWQYSSLTAHGDPQLTLWPDEDDQSWLSCWNVALGVLGGSLSNPAPGADSYYDKSIKPPDWTKEARFCKQIGRLFFYDVDHDYEAAAFPEV